MPEEVRGSRRASRGDDVRSLSENEGLPLTVPCRPEPRRGPSCARRKAPVVLGRNTATGRCREPWGREGAGHGSLGSGGSHLGHRVLHKGDGNGAVPAIVVGEAEPVTEPPRPFVGFQIVDHLVLEGAERRPPVTHTGGVPDGQKCVDHPVLAFCVSSQEVAERDSVIVQWARQRFEAHDLLCFVDRPEVRRLELCGERVRDTFVDADEFAPIVGLGPSQFALIGRFVCLLFECETSFRAHTVLEPKVVCFRALLCAREFTPLEEPVLQRRVVESHWSRKRLRSAKGAKSTA